MELRAFLFAQFEGRAIGTDRTESNRMEGILRACHCFRAYPYLHPTSVSGDKRVEEVEVDLVAPQRGASSERRPATIATFIHKHFDKQRRRFGIFFVTNIIIYRLGFIYTAIIHLLLPFLLFVLRVVL